MWIKEILYKFATSNINNSFLTDGASLKIPLKVMKSINNINEISDAEVLAILNGFMDEEKIAKKEENARVRRAKRAVKTEIAFHICLQSIEKSIKK